MFRRKEGKLLPQKEPSSLDRILGIMERRALEEQEVREIERDKLLNEMHRRLVAEELDDPEDRIRFEARVQAAEAHGWRPRGDLDGSD